MFYFNNRLPLIAFFFLLFLNPIPTLSNTESEQGKVRIFGRLSLNDGDSVQIVLSQHGINFDGFRKVYYAVVKDSAFAMELSGVNNPEYIDLITNKNGEIKYLLNLYLIEPGDNINIQQQGKKIIFSGRGAEKFNIRRELDSLDAVIKSSFKHSPSIAEHFAKLNLLIDNKLQYLEKSNWRISRRSFMILKSDIIGSIESYKLSTLLLEPEAEFWTDIKQLREYKGKLWKEMYVDFIKENPYSAFSINTSYFLIRKYNLDSCKMLGKPFDMVGCYLFMKRCLPASLGERVNMDLILEYKNKFPGLNYCVNDALIYFKDHAFRDFLQKKIKRRIKGELAYNFSLTDTSGRVYTLDDFKNKMLILDFWYTGCGSCVQEARELSRVSKLFQSDSILFITISIDKDKKRWIESIKKGEYTSAKTLNLYTQGLGINHPITQYYDVFQYPTLMAINGKGEIMETPVDPRLDNGESLIALISDELSLKWSSN